MDTFRVQSGSSNNGTTTDTGIDWSSFTVSGRSATSLFSLYIGMSLSRYGIVRKSYQKVLGLWVADLAITQIMQEYVAETERGTVFGVEYALCMFFSVGKDLLAILFPNPKTYGLLVLISAGCVLAGYVQYLYYYLRTKRNTSTEVVESTTYGTVVKDLSPDDETKPPSPTEHAYLR